MGSDEATERILDGVPQCRNGIDVPVFFFHLVQAERP